MLLRAAFAGAGKLCSARLCPDTLPLLLLPPFPLQLALPLLFCATRPQPDARWERARLPRLIVLLFCFCVLVVVVVVVSFFLCVALHIFSILLLNVIVVPDAAPLAAPSAPCHPLSQQFYLKLPLFFFCCFIFIHNSSFLWRSGVWDKSVCNSSSSRGSYVLASVSMALGANICRLFQS